MKRFTEIAAMSVAERVTDHLHRLLAALSADPSGEGAFWDRMEVERTPLIAPDPMRPGHSLVTYVFPLPDGAKYVVISPGFGRAKDNVLERIAGTNVCHASYRYRNDVRTTYDFRPDRPLIDFENASDAEWKAFQAALAATPLAADPIARETFTRGAGEGQPDVVSSILSLPDAPDQTFVQPRPDVPHGKVDRHMLRSDVLGNERRIWVYTPPGYKSGGRAYPMLLAFDGGASLTVKPIHRILDNLLADGRVRPMIAVFVDNPTPSRNEELLCSEAFARFTETELIPWVRGRYAVSQDPSDGYVTGHSAGGMAAMWIGLRLPNLFGVVISQSASLWWGPGWDWQKVERSQRSTPGWLIDEYERAPKQPLRIWQEIGLMEGAEEMIEPNRRMKAVLEAKGYDLIYRETAGGHDHAVWRGTIGAALTTIAPNVPD
jgi:enterochelin esterase family protein